MSFIQNNNDETGPAFVKKFEPIFCTGADYQSNACINWFHNPIELYAIGYKEAGDKIVEFVLLNATGQDVLIYPIVFLYRQYIELRLKEIIREGRRLLDEGNDFPTHHKIWDLWCVAKELTVRAFKNEHDVPDYKYAEHVIKEFSKIDPDSFAFRYPTKKNGDKTLDGLKYINISHLTAHIEALYKELEAMSSGLSVYHDWQQEMLSSY